MCLEFLYFFNIYLANTLQHGKPCPLKLLKINPFTLKGEPSSVHWALNPNYLSYRFLQIKPEAHSDFQMTCIHKHLNSQPALSVLMI